MYYSAIGILATMILIIENWDIILNHNSRFITPAWTIYRKFLLAVFVYYITDIVWGIFETLKLPSLLFADTSVYFIAMAVGILFWTQYAVAYPEDNSRFGRFLINTGRVFFLAITVLVAVNIFVPVLFTVDENCVYKACGTRHMILVAQIILLLLISLNTILVIKARRVSHTNRKRYRSLTFFGLIMAVNLTVQIWFPYMPLYSIAYMLGTCMLHSFVVGDESEEYKREVERALKREKQHLKDLRSAMELAYTDTLTGVKSKLAYVEMEEKKDLMIAEGASPEFAIVIFDLNGLKEINDRLGHEFGDQYIVKAVGLISECFNNCSIFRIGGDEFAVLLEGENYLNRQKMIELFNRHIDENSECGGVVVAAGMAEYQKDRDASVNQVFACADRQMYMRKRTIKETVFNK